MSYGDRFQRNWGFITDAEQQRLAEAVVAIAGAGGDGGQVALTLARMGVQHFRLADPEAFELENSNRQAGCNSQTIGRNKAEVIAELISAINPSSSVQVFTDGIIAANVNEFVDQADIVVDETDYTVPGVGVRLARAARSGGIAVVMGLNVGFGCLVTTFRADGRCTLERYLGLREHQSIQDIETQSVDLWRWVPRLPRYGRLSVLRAVQCGRLPAPSVAPGVNLAAAVVATEVFRLLTKQQRPVYAPAVLWCDGYERRTKIVRCRRLSFAASLARVIVRSRLGRPRPRLPT